MHSFNKLTKLRWLWWENIPEILGEMKSEERKFTNFTEKKIANAVSV